MTTTYFRIQDATRPVEQLLAPEYQTSLSYVDDSERAGVSVCGSIEDLAAYLAQSGMPWDPTFVLVEVEGYRSEDEDEDATLGALLVHPTAIVSVRPLDDGFFALLDSHLA